MPCPQQALTTPGRLARQGSCPRGVRGKLRVANALEPPDKGRRLGATSSSNFSAFVRSTYIGTYAGRHSAHSHRFEHLSFV